MQKKITTFLTFDDRAEEAIELYTSVFPGSKVLSTSRYGEGAPVPAGTFMTGSFSRAPWASSSATRTPRRRSASWRRCSR